MIPKECKRLAEVDFPIAVVSRHAVREKSIRYGHPSTLHLWWARRPLAACRAVLMGLLLPDPVDPICPKEFKDRARSLLADLYPAGPAEEDLRKALLKLIGDFANWDAASNPRYVKLARDLVQAAHPDEPPLVVDPFAGGGSIPLEALRLGCEAFASDLNPVACLILKVMLEDIPRRDPTLPEDLRRAGVEIKRTAEQELAEFYPVDHDGARPIAYLWARTVRCETPNCGAEIPLVRSFWLSKKARRKRALRFHVVREKDCAPQVEFEIFEPRTDAEVPGPTVSRAKATCPCCNMLLPAERVRAQLSAQRGGADVIFNEQGYRVGGARMLAVATLRPGERGRHFRSTTADDYAAVWRAARKLNRAASESLANGLTRLPDEPTPWQHGHRAVVSLRVYGMTKWSDLFSIRQKLALITLQDVIARVTAEGTAVREITGLALSRFTDISNAFCRWESTKTQVRNLFTRHDLPMLWDFAEPDLFAGQAGDYATTLETMIRVVEALQVIENVGQVQVADARVSPLPDETADVWFTDPPYYDAVAYADLSDFFFVWLKRILPDHALFHSTWQIGSSGTPKSQELTVTTVADEDAEPKSPLFFEQGIARAFASGRQILKEDGVGCVVFAHKTTQGWEALLSGMIQGGWTITGSWPIATELATRMNARENASLATSVHLVCRPRPMNASVGDWGDVLRELPRRVADWMERLQAEGIRGADLVFACIGPALEIYSRYSKVVDAEEREIPLGGNPEAREPHRRGYLAYIWEVVGRAALEQILGAGEARATNGAAAVLEEDARLTALFLWTIQSSNTTTENTGGAESPEEVEETDEGETAPGRRKKGFSLVYDVVRRFAQPLGIHLTDWEGRIIETEKGAVRLLPVTERAEQLFGEEGAQAVPKEFGRTIEVGTQLKLFPDLERDMVPQLRGGRGHEAATGVTDERLKVRREATTLDRVHAAMLLQKAGRTNALRSLLEAERDHSPNFLRLANALGALYPDGSEEKRLIYGMLQAIPR